MSIINSIPHTARFISTTNLYRAWFNNPFLGGYDFEDPVNGNVQVVLETQPNTVYLIERISFAANLDQGVYLSSLSNTPKLRLKRKVASENIHMKEYRLVNYIDNQEMVTWFQSDKQSDAIIMEVTGRLIQVPETVGVDPVVINISFAIYAIEDKNFLIKHKNMLERGAK